MLSIISAIAIFTIVILGLSFMLMYANKKLVPQGDVNIIVNLRLSREVHCLLYYQIRMFSYHLPVVVEAPVPCVSAM